MRPTTIMLYICLYSNEKGMIVSSVFISFSSYFLKSKDCRHIQRGNCILNCFANSNIINENNILSMPTYFTLPNSSWAHKPLTHPACPQPRVRWAAGAGPRCRRPGPAPPLQAATPAAAAAAATHISISRSSTKTITKVPI